MAEGIVHLLEAVQVNEKYRAVVAIAPGLGDGLLEQGMHHGPVGQAGEGIVIGQAVDLLFRVLALGDVAEHGKKMGRLAVPVMHRAGGHPGGKQFAVLALQPQLADPVAAVGDGMLHVGVEFFVVKIGEEEPGRLPQGFLLRVAGDLAEGPVDGNDMVLCVRHHDAFVAVLENRRLQAQLLLGAQPFGDIHQVADDAAGVAIGAKHQGQGQAGPEHLPRLLAPPHHHLPPAALAEKQATEEAILLVLVGIDEEDVAPDGFLGRVAEEVLGAFVPTGDVAAQIHGDHRIMNMVDDLALLFQLLFALQPAILALVECEACVEQFADKIGQGLQSGHIACGEGPAAHPHDAVGFALAPDVAQQLVAPCFHSGVGPNLR